MSLKKSIVLLIFAGLGLISTSCTPDYVNNPPQPNNPQIPNPDPNPQPGNTTIVGKWKKIGLTEEGEESIAFHDHECLTIFDYIQFFDNGTVKDVGYFEDCTTTETDNGTYTLTGNILSIQGNNPDGSLISGQLIVTELTATSLKIKDPLMELIIVFEKY